MFIETEATPNPASLKFLPGQAVMGEGKDPLSFSCAASAQQISPLAFRLFSIPGVRGVLFGSDFISVTLADPALWSSAKPLVFAELFEQFSSSAPLLIGGGPVPSSCVERAEDTAVVLQIRELLDLRIRPAVAQDGGDIVFHKFEKGILWLEMHGACAGCPSSTLTLKAGIEAMMRRYIPEVLEVRAVQDD